MPQQHQGTASALRLWEVMSRDEQALQAKWVQVTLDKQSVKVLKELLVTAGVDSTVLDPKRTWRKDQRCAHLVAPVVSEAEPCLFWCVGKFVDRLCFFFCFGSVLVRGWFLNTTR